MCQHPTAVGHACETVAEPRDSSLMTIFTGVLFAVMIVGSGTFAIEIVLVVVFVPVIVANFLYISRSNFLIDLMAFSDFNGAAENKIYCFSGSTMES